MADQALFAGHRATGQTEVVQCVWVYEHAVDFEGLRRFHHNLSRGLLGRRIERSPLPFARHRWVAERGSSDIEVAKRARPRAELSDWVDERSQLPTDAEWGPGWHLGVLPLTDGSTAISLVVSHYLIDGLGLGLTIAEAILGKTRDLGYPPPGARTRLRAALQDARQTARDIPEVGRALVTAAKLARSQRRDMPRRASQSVAPREGDGDEVVVLPFITIFIDIDDWDARAEALGGAMNTLVAGFAAKLGERIGRRRADDGTVTLHLPISDRSEGDTRAVAVSFASVSVDPTKVTTDLRDVRFAIKEAMRAAQETPGESVQQILWLTPFTPKRALRRLGDAMVADPDLPVFCSNLGGFGSVVSCADGTNAEYMTARGTRQHVTRQWLERVGGLMTVLSARIPGKIGISVLAYQPGAIDSKPALRELAARTLVEFDLTGEIN